MIIINNNGKNEILIRVKTIMVIKRYKLIQIAIR